MRPNTVRILPRRWTRLFAFWAKVGRSWPHTGYEQRVCFLHELKLWAEHRPLAGASKRLVFAFVQRVHGQMAWPTVILLKTENMQTRQQVGSTVQIPGAFPKSPEHQAPLAPTPCCDHDCHQYTYHYMYEYCKVLYRWSTPLTWVVYRSVCIGPTQYLFHYEYAKVVSKAEDRQGTDQRHSAMNVLLKYQHWCKQQHDWHGCMLLTGASHTVRSLRYWPYHFLPQIPRESTKYTDLGSKLPKFSAQPPLPHEQIVFQMADRSTLKYLPTPLIKEPECSSKTKQTLEMPQILHRKHVEEIRLPVHGSSSFSLTVQTTAQTKAPAAQDFLPFLRPHAHARLALLSTAVASSESVPPTQHSNPHMFDQRRQFPGCIASTHHMQQDAGSWIAQAG